MSKNHNFYWNPMIGIGTANPTVWQSVSVSLMVCHFVLQLIAKLKSIPILRLSLRFRSNEGRVIERCLSNSSKSKKPYNFFFCPTSEKVIKWGSFHKSQSDKKTSMCTHTRNWAPFFLFSSTDNSNICAMVQSAKILE